jgi:hypothetical protein
LRLASIKCWIGEYTRRKIPFDFLVERAILPKL